MSAFPKQLVVVATLLDVAASLTVPVAQAATCQAQNATSGGAVSADLQAVIDAAAAGDTVHVAGTCSGGFVIDKDLIVARAPGADRAILDGGGVSRVLTIAGVAPSIIAVTLKNLRITGGVSTRGGVGIMMKRAAVRLQSTRVDHNRTKDSYAAGIYKPGRSNSSLVLGGSTTVRNNHARGGWPGGGIYARGTVRLRGSSTIASNSAILGGGIYAERIVMVDQSRVVHNTAGRGGGIAADEVIMRELSEVSNNTSRRGGGVQLDRCGNPLNCSLRMTDRSRLEGNYADLGGGVYSLGSVFLRDHASIVRNTATKTGGGVLSNRVCDNRLLPTVVRDDSTISRNAPNDIVNAKARGCP